ncbi:MAG: ABC transporter permease [Candidatus Tectimicrobiota bacterium]|nr:MAG: ABC transporter permease [Candidatus Tectomicrobia bacterium]
MAVTEARARTLLGQRLGAAWQAVHAFFQREAVMGMTFVAPAFLILLVLVAYPFCMALYLSLTDAFVGRPGKFVGLRNFVALLQDSTFRQTLRNAFVFTGASVALKTVLGLMLALTLNQNLKCKRFFRGAVLLPWVIPSALGVLGWWWMFDSLYSVINWTLVHLGLVAPPGPNWLGRKDLAMIAVIMVNTWRGLPFFAISMLAGLVAIPQELYEAAATDGAGKLSKFWYITLPMLKPVLAIVVLFSTIFTMSNFEIVYVLTGGGPMNSTHLFATLTRQVGLESGYLGTGAAISLFLFPVLVFVVYFQLKLARRETL